MKQVFLSLMALAISWNVLQAQSMQSIAVGTQAPKVEVKMKDVSGKEVSIKEMMQENGVLVMFSCNTCPYVIKNQDRTKDIAAYALNKKVGVIVLNPNEAYRKGEDSYTAMQEYAKAQQYNWPYVVDQNHQVADAYGATKTPEIFLINKEGIVVYKGAIDDSPADAKKVERIHLRHAIDEMVTKKDIAVKESKSVGCTIKRL
jgi:peroxiredoxin